MENKNPVAHVCNLKLKKRVLTTHSIAWTCRAAFFQDLTFNVSFVSIVLELDNGLSWTPIVKVPESNPGFFLRESIQ